MNNHQGGEEPQPDFSNHIHHHHKKRNRSKKANNDDIGKAAVGAAFLQPAFLATATGAAASKLSQNRKSLSPPTYGHPTTSGSWSGGAPPPKLLLEVPRASNSHSPSPISSISGQLKELRKRSLSEISLILEIIKGVTAGVDASSKSGSRRFRTASPSTPRQSTGGGSLNRVSLSTGDLGKREESMEEENRRYLRVPMEDGKSSPALSRISSFVGQKKITATRIRWNRLSPQHIQRTMDMVQEEKAMQMAPNAPIDATKFVAYVQERRKKRILFKGEYLMVVRSVDPQKCTTEVGIRMGDKNQYNDTLPYDYNRVILESRSGFEDSHGISDYINASYVQSWMKEKAYVVTQAVKTKQASNDFWRCVWEMRSNAIVMLTKVFDFMRVMCLQYWPQGKFQFGEIDVETLETKTYAHFVVRTFRLTRLAGGTPSELEETRIVKHFHFTEWELNSFPYISAFIELRRRVRQWTDKTPHPDNLTSGPVIVHCSNGGGRSGAFLALDANLELLEKTGQVDVYEYAKTLVNSRQHLIESVDQYTFIYDILCEAIMCNIEPIEMHRLKERSTMYKSKKDRELMEMQITQENKLLLMLTSTLRIGDCAGGHRLENRGKNRDVMVVPPDHARPYLQTLHGESKDYTYINAVEVDGFTRKSEFIVTEWPKQQTLDSFWTLVFDHSVHTVINLTNPSNNKIYPPFIHSKGKKNYGPFMVEIVNCQQYPGLTSYMAKITKRTMEDMQKRKPSAMEHCFKKKQRQLTRRPTLRHFLAECSRRHSRLPMLSREDSEANLLTNQNFRLQQKYWGKVRSSSLTDVDEGEEDGLDTPASPRRPKSMEFFGEDKALKRQRSKRRKQRRMAQSANGPQFKSDLQKQQDYVDSEDSEEEDDEDEEEVAMWPETLRMRAFSQPNLGTLERFEKRGDDEIRQLLNVKRTAPARRDLAEQMEKLTFMISEIMATGASQQQLEAEVRLCCVIQVKMWPIENKVPCSTSALIDLIKMTRSWRKRAPDRPETKPTIVMSHNGVSRCGIFIGANVCIDQMDMDHEVDVFHAVKMIRLNRPQQLQTKDEYKYLYDLCLHYYMTNPDYRIHEPPEPPVQPYEDDYDEEVEERETTPASSGIIGAIAGGLTRSRSSSRKGRTRSVRSRRSPTSTLNNCVVVKQPTMLVNNSNVSPSKQKKETVYLN